MASIRHMTQTYSQRIKQFLGVNESPTGDNGLKAGEAEYIRNWQITQDGKLRTRPGTRLVNRASTISNMYGQPIRGMWTGWLNGEEIFLFAHCGRVWYATAADMGVSTKLPTFHLATGSIEDSETEFFEMDNVVYILTENHYYKWESLSSSITEITAANAYAPLIAVDCSPAGSYQVQEIPNLLTARRRCWFSPDGESTTYVLPEGATEIISVTSRSTGESISYTAVSGYDSSTNIQCYTAITLSEVLAKSMNAFEVEYESANVNGGNSYGVSLEYLGGIPGEVSLTNMMYCSITNDILEDPDNTTFEYGDVAEWYLTIKLDVDTGWDVEECYNNFVRIAIATDADTSVQNSVANKSWNYITTENANIAMSYSSSTGWYTWVVTAAKGDTKTGELFNLLARIYRAKTVGGSAYNCLVYYNKRSTSYTTVQETLTENRNKILRMTHHEFFSGGADNYLFLYGDGSNVIYYSDVDTDGNPRADYFPTMDEVFVGSAGSKVTSLIRHYGYLLAFKPDECYRISYDGVYQNTGGYSQNMFSIKPVNRAVGCSAMAQAVLVNNNPRTPFENALMEWTLSYSSTTVNRDERNAKRISDRVWETVKGMELSGCVCFDDETRHEYWCTDGTTSLVNNYARDTWTVYTGIAPTCFATWQGDLYLGTASGYVVRMSEDYAGDQNISPQTYTFKKIPYVTTENEKASNDVSFSITDSAYLDINFGGSLYGLGLQDYYSTATSQRLVITVTTEDDALTSYMIAATLTCSGVGGSTGYSFFRITGNSGGTFSTVLSNVIAWIAANPNGTVYIESLTISPETSDVTNNPSITATWRSGSLDLGYPYLNKWNMELYVGLLPEGGKKLTVSAVSDRKTDLASREITTGTEGDTPLVHHVRIRAKQWAYLKEQLQTSESPVTVTSLDTLYRTGTSGRRGLS